MEHGRDRSAERALLAAAGASAEYAAAVQARLDMHGHTIRERHPAEAVGEALEESIDQSGWLLCTVANAQDLPPEHQALLETLIAYGHTSWRLATVLQAALAEQPRAVARSVVQ